MLSHIPRLGLILTLCLPYSVAKSRLQFGEHGFSDSHPFGSPSKLVEVTQRSIVKRNDDPTYIWLQADEYSGKTFFDRWNFFSDKDPTNGHVNYVNRSRAFGQKLVYVEDNGTVIMKGDSTTWLDRGVFRESVRISSWAQYTTGLFILDLNKAPWGCAVWPAFWTLGANKWPDSGEIDIIEGVHDNEHNQVAWHTRAGCFLTPEANFTGTVVQHDGKDNVVCDGNVNQNSGCGITEWSRASYGPYFDSIQGGVFAMKWDEEGISVWSFYRGTVPKDIIDGSPKPSGWGVPSAALDAKGCDPLAFFVNHSIIFDITFCGDWAGNSYATSGCGGTCEERLMDPNNFVNATWSINSLKVYRKELIRGRINNGLSFHSSLSWGILCTFMTLAAFHWFGKI